MSLGAWPLSRGRFVSVPPWPGGVRRLGVFHAATALAVLIVVLYEASDLAGVPWPLESQEFAPIALFAIPMLYATRTSSRIGALATAAWVALLVALDVVLTRQGLGRWADRLQVALIGTVAIFVGRRVEYELRVRHRAEAAREALRVSEMRYRSLFEHSQTPILLAETDGTIREANGAADELLRSGAVGARRRSLQALLGGDVADRLLAGKPSDAVRLRDAQGVEATFQPRSTGVREAGSGTLVQVVLQDITAERRQQHRLDTYAMHVLQAHEDERRTIAQELHDEPIQALISLYRRLDAIACQDALPPPSLDDLGLVPAVRRVLQEFEERTTISTSLRLRGDARRLPPELELGLYRIVQEALHNVDRHAAARHVAVGLAFVGGVRVSVSDDGVGFPGLADAAGSGLGLLGMQERASLLGGRLAVRSSVGRGTTIRVTVPAPGGHPWPVR